MTAVDDAVALLRAGKYSDNPQNIICTTDALIAALLQLQTSSPPSLSSGQILVGNVANVAAAVALSGDATLSNTGAITVTKTGGVAFTGFATAAPGQAPATATNDNAAAGKVGEYISATVLIGAAVPLTTGAAANITSIPLTAGDWDVTCAAAFTGGATTTVTQLTSSISQTTGTIDTQNGAQGQVIYPAGFAAFGTQDPKQTIGPFRISLAGSATIFFVARAAFAVSTCSAFGLISARRAR